MSVRPHPAKGDGWWIVDYYPAGRKGKRVRFPYQGTKGEALALEQELRRAHGEVVNEVAPLVKDLVAPWLEYYQNEVAPRTYDDAISTMAHWLPVFGNFKPANITQNVINQYKNSRLQAVANTAAVERGKPPRLIKKRTVNKELSYFSSCLKWAAQNGHCAELPFQIKGFPGRQTKAVAPKVLTPRQMTAMYKVIEEEYKLLFLLMADMGLRVSEALDAKAEDADEYHETLSVVGKGSKQRMVPWASDRFRDELLRALDQRPEGFLSRNPATGERFVDVRKALNRAARKAGIERIIKPHLLRHSCLTKLAQQGMSPHALQQFAGHSSITTTNKIYVHIRSDYVGDEIRKIREQERRN